MAVPPTYVDLGKSAKDVFTKGYGKHQAASLTHLSHIGQALVSEVALFTRHAVYHFFYTFHHW